MVESPTHWFADDVIYRRTQAGQRELIAGASALTPTARRFLAMVTGHTPLRVLLDMGGDDPDIGATIRDLSSRGLIKLEEY